MAAQAPMILLLACALACQAASGKKQLDVWYLGSLDSGLHGIRGKVYAASGDTLVLRDFSYDGRAPGARFIVGRGDSPDGNGVLLTDDSGRNEAIKAYRNQTLVLKLTPGNKITDFNWFSVFDRKAKRSLAHVEIPGRPASAEGEDGGNAPDTYFVVGKGNEPGIPKGIKLMKEKGSTSALGMYAGVNLRLTLPENITVDDVDWFAVSCAKCTRPLVQGTIPKRIDVPANLNTRWIKRKSRLGLLRVLDPPDDPKDYKNCETIVKDTIQVSWHLENDLIHFYVRAMGAVNMWTAFGISGADDRSKMEGADVTVITVAGPDNKVYVEDYFLTEKSQCSSKGKGVCPDIAQSGNDDLKVISASFSQGIVEAVYYRKLDTGDSRDKVIKARGKMAVVAAQGPVNEQESGTILYHTMVVTRRMFGWGISWWINGELIPVLHLERGTAYTFIPEGGHNQSLNAQYHPFYITDNNKGEGRFCEYRSTPASYKATTVDDFSKSMKLVCDDSGPRTQFTWTPDENTPDTLYYQCWTHFYLGWKIQVHDHGDTPKPTPPPPPPTRKPTTRKPKPKPKPKPKTKSPTPPESDYSGDSGGSGGSGGSGDAVRPALPPFLFACAAILATLLLRRQAGARHAWALFLAVNR
ncbi:hypothetical protein MRX96_031963 [Rhipicephalus microplus]